MAADLDHLKSTVFKQTDAKSSAPSDAGYGSARCSHARWVRSSFLAREIFFLAKEYDARMYEMVQSTT